MEIELDKVFLDFQKQWTIKKIEDMTLQEYSSINDRNTFTYWLEYRLKNLGTIGGIPSFKFGIFERNPLKSEEIHTKRGLTYTSKYAWSTKYGDSPSQAFETIKSNIIKVIEATQLGNLETIDKIDLYPTYKWKIAFHYQNIKKPSILAVFKKEVLEEYIQQQFPTISSYQRIIFKNEKIKNFKQCLETTEKIWNKYRNNFSNKERRDILRKQQIEILQKEENERKEIRILSRKRNSKIVAQRKELDKYTCQNPKCAFCYQQKITEVHHLIPLYTADDVKITSINDLITLCPTCHRLAHYFLTHDAKKNRISENMSKFTQRKELLKVLSETPFRKK